MENKYSKPNTTRKKVKFLGTKEFIDASTGEKEAVHVDTITERNDYVHRMSLEDVVQAVDVIEYQVISVSIYIMEYINKESVLVRACRVIADKAKTTLPARKETMTPLL